MSITKKIELEIPELFRSNDLDVALFYFVSGVQYIRPLFMLKAAVDEFISFMNIDYCNFTTEQGLSVYYRMQKKYLKLFREKQVNSIILSLFRTKHLDTGLFYFISGIKTIRENYLLYPAISHFNDFMKIDELTHEYGEQVYESMLKNYNKNL